MSTSKACHDSRVKKLDISSIYGKMSAMSSLPVTPTVFTSWSQLRDKLAGYDHRWAFRGMASADWPLKTSLERLLVSPIVEAERYMLTKFQRRAHHYVRDCPKLDDYVEWLAEVLHDLHRSARRGYGETRPPLFTGRKILPSSMAAAGAICRRAPSPAPAPARCGCGFPCRPNPG